MTDEERLWVKPFSTDPDALFSLNWTLENLPRGGSLAKGDDGEYVRDGAWFLVVGGDQKFLEFAVKRQGYAADTRRGLGDTK